MHYQKEDFDPNKILIAQPGLINLTAEVQKEVANSPAFQCLEENFYRGNISGTEVALLKMKYAEHYNCLTNTRDNEYNLLQMSKRFIGALEIQNAELSKSDHFPENISTTVSRLRCEHLRTENTLMATEERVEKLLYKMELLMAERKMLQREYSRMPKSELDNLGDEDIIEAMHRRTKTLQIENQELNIEMDKLKRERHKLGENLRLSYEQESETKELRHQMMSNMEKVKSELFITSQLPGQYSKEYEKLRRQKIDAEKELAQANDTSVELTQSFNDLNQKLIDTNNEIAEVKTKINGMKKDRNDLTQQHDDILKFITLQREYEMQHRTEKASQELQLQTLAAYKKEYMETMTKVLREKDRLTKNLKTLLLQLNVASEMLYQTKQIYDKEKVKYMHFPRDDYTYLEKKERLMLDVSGLKASLEEEANRESMVVSKVQQVVSETDRRLFILDSHRSECVELTKLSVKMAEKRERGALDFLRAERRYKRIRDEIEAKATLIQDQAKELDILNYKALSVARLYSEVKMERNKCVALLQLTTQNHLMFKEHLKLRLNEQSISLTHLYAKEANIVSLLTNLNAVTKIRDNIRNDICRWAATRTEQNFKREEMRLQIQRLNGLFNKIEADIIQTKKLTEKNILFRNERAMQLIERNEDVFILDERTKLQNSRYRSAQIDLQALEEQVRCMTRYKLQLVDMVDLSYKKVPVYEGLKLKVKNLLDEYRVAQTDLNELVERVEDPTAEGRLRFLEGRDLDSENLRVKVGVVEERLINKEEQLLEKDLLYEAVSRLVDQVQLRSDIGREDTIKVAKTINRMKSKIMRVDKMLKLNAAELTIKMTKTFNLTSDGVQDNHILNKQYDRLERKMTPSLEVKKEYNRKKTHKAIREDYKKNKNIKKKFYPKLPRSQILIQPLAPEYRLPPLRTNQVSRCNRSI